MMSIDVKITKEVAKPRSAAEKKERKKTLAAKKKEPAKSTDINEAAKEVAETLGGGKSISFILDYRLSQTLIKNSRCEEDPIRIAVNAAE